MVLKKGSKEYAAAVAAYKQHWMDKEAARNKPFVPKTVAPLNANGGGLITQPGEANPLANSLAAYFTSGKGKETAVGTPKESLLRKLMNGGMDAGSRTLDVLSRGTYASANIASAAAEIDRQDKKDPRQEQRHHW